MAARMGGGFGGERIHVCIRMTESLCSAPETITLIGYTLKKFFKNESSQENMLRPSNTGPTFSEARLPPPVLQPSAPPATFPGSPSSLPFWGRRFTSQDLSTLRQAGVGRGGGSETEARRQGIFGAPPLKQEARWGHTSFSTWLGADDAIPAAPG